MKIVSLVAHNIKRLHAVQITPSGNVIQITGKNGSGKSSVLDAIWWALDGKSGIAREPVRKGETKARITLDLGDYVVTRRFTTEGTSLVVQAADGARYPSPQSLLDRLLGDFTFDPLEFARLDVRGRAEALRHLLKLDFRELDAEIEVLFSARTERNRAVKSLEARVAEAKVQVDPAMDVTLIDVDELARTVENADAANEARGRIVAEYEQQDIRYSQTCQDVDDIGTQIERLRVRQAEQQRAADQLKDAMQSRPTVPEKVDVSAAVREVQTAHHTNRERQKQTDVRGIHDRLVDQLHLAAIEVATMTAEIDAKRQAKVDQVAATAMPVDGVGFDDEGRVTYRDVPFEQASSAEQLRVSVAIAMALNPKLRVLRVKDGSLLDEASLQLLTDMAEKQDYQVWLEKVDTSGRVGVVMEDGHVVAVDGAPIQQSDEADAALAAVE